MTKGINYWAFPPDSSGSPPNVADTMKYALTLGYDSFEITVDPGGPISFDTSDRDLKQLRNQADALGIALPTVASGFAWDTPPSADDTATRATARDRGIRLLEIASILGAHTVLYIPGVVSASFVPELGITPHSEVLERAQEAVGELIPKATALEVGIGIENVWNRFLLDPESMKRFIDSFDSDSVGCYFDTGNVMLYGHPEDWIRTLGDRIRAVHMKDFRVDIGNLNGFVDLLAGDVDFGLVMSALSEIGFSGPTTIEYVPGTLGAAEKGIAALNLIEGMAS